MATLSNTQKRHLKGLAHPLKSVVMVGDKGLTTNVLNEINRALDTHELIKVNIRADREERYQISEKIINKTLAEKVQMIGSKLILFKRNKEAKIAIPK